MKYIINAEERELSKSTLYFELQIGRHEDKHWLTDSLYIHADIFDDLQLYKLLKTAGVKLDYYGVTQVSKSQWLKTVKQSVKNDLWRGIVSELEPWVEACYEENDCFSIVGI